MIRKVLEVEGHYRLTATRDGGGEDMPVVWVWKIQAGGDGLPPADARVIERRIHCVEPTLDSLLGDVRVNAHDGVTDFVEDPIRPQWPEESRLGHPQQRVAECVRNEHAGIEDSGVHRYACFARPSANAAWNSSGDAS